MSKNNKNVRLSANGSTRGRRRRRELEERRISSNIGINKRLRGINTYPRYYAQYNHPNFYKFGTPEFLDDEGREYKIARENGYLLQSRRLYGGSSLPSPRRGRRRTTPTRTGGIKMGYGNTLQLWIKIPKGKQWMTAMKIGKLFNLKNISSGDEFPVRLKGIFKGDRRKTGTVIVSIF